MSGDTHTCGNCGDRGQQNPNPIDSCGRDLLECNNPCRRGPGNSAQCESLPSQIQNFTDQFFGAVVKTEINGAVTWSLPCQLDVGLPGNPRGVDEGLACYFLRLFQDGIGGLQGPQGVPGANGSNGKNAYGVTRQGFNQPTLNSPLVQLLVFDAPALVVGLTVFIPDSGTYTITDIQPGGIVFATLDVPVTSPVSYVPAGSLVIPSGGPGPVGPQGAQGVQGVQGKTGPTGPAFLGQQGFIAGAAGQGVYVLSTAATNLGFSGGPTLKFTAPASGKYLITGIFTVLAAAPNAGTPSLTVIYASLRNLTTSTDIPGALTHIEPRWYYASDFFEVQLVVNVVCSVGANQTVGLMGYYDIGIGGTITALPEGASLSWVQVA